MSKVKLKIQFQNGLELERSVGIGRACDLLERPNVWVPEEAILLEFRSANSSIVIPMVLVVSMNSALIPPQIPPFTKQGLYASFNGACAYCGEKIDYDASTIDHVNPKSQGGETIWENTVLACKRCNTQKDNRTPKQARMHLRVKPHVPKARMRKVSQ